MAQHITRYVVKRNSPQHAVLQLVRQRGAITVDQLIQSNIYSPHISGGWVTRVQTMIDRSLVSVIDTSRMVSKVCVGANDKPARLQMTLTAFGMSELRRLTPPDDDTAQEPARPVVPHPYRRVPRFEDLPMTMDRPPVLRAGAMDFARCPSVVGESRVEYAPHC
ncbi:hypothetical protein X805_04670 [Sphaerotilus natans subsp. natans DSM 6575]|uniref:Uncharacterized protein n=1 Tax=Sphaerotilus natans subsp. natans DSM 6575 TaxID=1286631 RepID=A0A059KS28_9BURK|nr:hypothetical protein [Sphaerotilus natans]KDB53913.1 hypothetical protein X805_04670 [Sphaerotilus natans subsp. natans DSM 6575]SIR68466.1 hypothetical protein SAMN05421778_11488 [Sphaerotilus natans]